MMRSLLRTATCAFTLLFLLLAVSAEGQIYQNILTFNTDGENGSYGQYSSLVQGTDGRMYGTGYVENSNEYFGSVYSMTPDGEEKMAYRFCSELNCSDGIAPQGNVVEGPDGDFFGTTSGGGADSNKDWCPQGCGTVYRITRDGELITVYSFCALTNCADGAVPLGGMVAGADGYLYGTTSSGGYGGSGTVFTITPHGDLVTLYQFCSIKYCADGRMPNAPLLQGSDGSLYGTTVYGGATGYGTIFRMTTGGVLTTVYNFCTGDCHYGFYPSGGLTQGVDGNLYGTTASSVRGDGGTIFKFSPQGRLTMLHRFCFEGRDCSDGARPETGVTLGSDGYLYGTTSAGRGSIFRISPSGDFQFIRGFWSAGLLEGGLAQGTNGLFYGYCAGESGDRTCTKDDPYYGNVFTMSMGLKPFVKTSPTFGAVSAPITILGSHLIGATAVSFNGTPAAFNVVSESEITTNVPSGATSGWVEVTTPKGTLMSNLPFKVNQ
jgi:uncharacterized repeat protein (TIGR03803 family)